MSMNQISEVFTEQAEFFAPASNDMLDTLLAQYRAMRIKIERVAEFVANDMMDPIDYFLRGNAPKERYALDRLFNLEGGIKALNAAYWSRALEMTDVLQVMPQKRRDEWSKHIHEMNTPEFEESAVRATIEDLLSARHKFFAEKVDGIFRALSHEHVTNCPQGFSKRMILGGVTEGYYYTSTTQCGHINDLRAVIAKFMGRDEPRWNSTSSLINSAKRQRGQWMNVDGGSMRIRVYLKGTAHLEIHPDMAWRLNQVLASLYPMAIPAEHRTPPKKKHKEFQMMDKPLPFAVIEIIAEMRWNRTSGTWGMYGSENKAAYEQATKALQYLGGVADGHAFRFDYDFSDVRDELICSGCIPDKKSHQFYPTPPLVAEEAIEIADLCADDKCLEPSAGIGGLADEMGACRQITCVEISELHCKVLEAKGYHTVNADFLSWSDGKYDKIIMNPPYSEGRWQAHITHAATMLTPDGELIAVLPASAKNKDVLPGMKHSWSRVFSNEFAGTSVSVVILKATK